MREDQALEIAEIFRLLGDSTRLRIVVCCLNRPKNVAAIAAAVGASPSLVSHHLRLLRSCRLVRADRHGRRVFYTAADAHVRCIVNDMIDHAAETEGASHHIHPDNEAA
ncbi:MAG: winged helix-turn-helix transcriptional regulator [Rhodospirillales bacterium]|nr:winged helix-turn-helix transcriptional regulator [Rhodospirillales bacterium]